MDVRGENMASLALVTGASSGIGQATAEKLAESGFSLILLARRKERLEQLRSKLLKINANIQVFVFEADISDSQKLAQLAEDHREVFSKVTTLVNNAGVALGKSSFEMSSQSDADTMIATNLTGLIHLTRLILPTMIEKAHGDIVIVGSVAGRWTYSGGAVYCATKYAVRAFAEALRQDLCGKDIRVINIEPGMVETEFSLVRFKDSKVAKEVYEGMTPLNANDIAETIVWSLLRPRHVNIQELIIYPTAQASPLLVSRTESVE